MSAQACTRLEEGIKFVPKAIKFLPLSIHVRKRAKNRAEREREGEREREREREIARVHGAS